ncbi:ABC transporter permease [Campylobacter mucosalis]|uniref:Lipoprotein releasing system, transmembrane protein, LolC/E family n=1 Tax=Campylobacter mucosalis CCUG 21559 TaxID=1032067 RepID=A0A6G5QIE2_9BACT|nr:ABC transporter permease [Campylobacter mucosalis]QCD45384.1 lipoprotein releasing system, transmembrane protein, LolC/E family [Campylobacter mucosalis CCUG 21559]
MSLPKYLLFKYLRFDKTQPFISLSALLAFLGVSIGLMVLIVAMAIMNGFDKEFERKLFTMNYPISILSGFKASINDELVNELKQKFPDLKFSPFISTQVILRGQNSLEGGLLFGVNSADEKEINSVVKAGLNALELGDFEILVGNGLKDTLGINNGEKITAIFTKADPSGFSLIPKMKRFDVVAGFSSGLVAYDKAYSYTSVESLRKILEYPAGIYDGIHIYSAEPFDDIKRIQSALPLGLKAIGWWQQNGNFFSALQLEKRALFIVLMLIILVASLNIVSSLLMTVMNRRQEIALLLALGASKSEIKKSFFLQGFVIGGGGIIFGIILGLFGIWLLGNFNIINLPADVYGSSKLPMELSLMDFSLIVFGAILIVCISSYYPAKKASEVNILQTLRNE